MSIDYADRSERTPRRIGRAPAPRYDHNNAFVDTERIQRIQKRRAVNDAAHEHYNEVYRRKKAADVALKQHVADQDRDKPSWLKSYVTDPVFAASTKKKKAAIVLKRATLQKIADEKRSLVS